MRRSVRGFVAVVAVAMAAAGMAWAKCEGEAAAVREAQADSARAWNEWAKAVAEEMAAEEAAAMWARITLQAQGEWQAAEHLALVAAQNRLACFEKNGYLSDKCAAEDREWKSASASASELKKNYDLAAATWRTKQTAAEAARAKEKNAWEAAQLADRNLQRALREYEECLKRVPRAS